MRKQVFGGTIVTLTLLVLVSCHQHTWVPADCTTPKTCSICGETEGSPMGHDFSWDTIKEASCTVKGQEVGTCSVCGEKEYRTIDKLAHIPSDDWVVDEQTIAETLDWRKGKLVQLCEVCHEILDEEPYEFTKEEQAIIINRVKENCKTYTYEEISRRPDNYIGEPAKFKGEVFQVMEDGNIVNMLVHVTKGKYGIWTDILWVDFIRDPSESRILESDIITVYGVLGDMVTYETVNGNSLTVPAMFGVYIELN